MLDPKIKKFEQLYKIYQTQSKNCSYSKKIKLLLLNAPCNGFGDLIFVKKLADYIRNAFKISVTIATTEPKKLLMLGEQKRYLKKLASIENSTMSVRPCRVFMIYVCMILKVMHNNLQKITIYILSRH